MPGGAGPLPHLLVHGYVEDREFARGGGGGNPKVRPVERRAHGERVKSEADTALATQDARQDARRESLVELESLGVVITIEGATGFRLKLDSLEQRTTHTQPRLADRCRPAPAPTQRKAAGQAFRVVRSDQETLPIGEGELRVFEPGQDVRGAGPRPPGGPGQVRGAARRGRRAGGELPSRSHEADGIRVGDAACPLAGAGVRGGERVSAIPARTRSVPPTTWWCRPWAG